MPKQSDIIIRLATATDADTVAAFNKAMAEETEGKTLSDDVISSGVAGALRDPERSLYFLGMIGAAVAGQTMITTEWSDWRNGYFWWIQSVYVHPDFRRRGVFRSLYAHIRDLAQERSDVRGLRLYVHNTNTRAIEAYKTLGMTMTEYLLCEEVW